MRVLRLPLCCSQVVRAPKWGVFTFSCVRAEGLSHSAVWGTLARAFMVSICRPPGFPPGRTFLLDPEGPVCPHKGPVAQRTQGVLRFAPKIVLHRTWAPGSKKVLTQNGARNCPPGANGKVFFGTPPQREAANFGKSGKQQGFFVHPKAQRSTFGNASRPNLFLPWFFGPVQAQKGNFRRSPLLQIHISKRDPKSSFC